MFRLCWSVVLCWRAGLPWWWWWRRPRRRWGDRRYRGSSRVDAVGLIVLPVRSRWHVGCRPRGFASASSVVGKAIVDAGVILNRVAFVVGVVGVVGWIGGNEGRWVIRGVLTIRMTVGGRMEGVLLHHLVRLSWLVESAPLVEVLVFCLCISGGGGGMVQLGATWEANGHQKPESGQTPTFDKSPTTSTKDGPMVAWPHRLSAGWSSPWASFLR